MPEAPVEVGGTGDRSETRNSEPQPSLLPIWPRDPTSKSKGVGWSGECRGVFEAQWNDILSESEFSLPQILPHPPANICQFALPYFIHLLNKSLWGICYVRALSVLGTKNSVMKKYMWFLPLTKLTGTE